MSILLIVELALLLPSIVVCYSYTNGIWLPVASISSIVGSKHKKNVHQQKQQLKPEEKSGNILPISVEIANNKYVVWTSDEGSNWSIARDICSHRLAPLSQGRVNGLTGHIECPYHGWCFDSNGMCTHIPQLSLADAKAVIPSSTSLNEVVPSYITGDMIWGFFKHSFHSDEISTMPVATPIDTTLPDIRFPVLNNITSFYVRDLPYSFDFLVENFIDPAHIPFAHHNLQAKRSDGSPISMRVLTKVDSNSTHCEVAFTDKIRNKVRNGIVSFISPCYYHFRIESQLVPSLLALIAPVSSSKGTSRIFLSLSPGKTSRLFSILPKWLLHGSYNRFLNSDIWIHDQERAALQTVGDSDSNSRRVNKYVLPTTSDIGVITWRQFYNKYLSSSEIFRQASNPVWMQKEEQTSAYKTHLVHCTDCRKSLRLFSSIHKYLFVVGVIPFLYKRSTFMMRVTGIAVYACLRVLLEKMIATIEGPRYDATVSAAQM